MQAFLPVVAITLWDAANLCEWSGMSHEASEFDLIARLTAELPLSASVFAGVGDDAAVLNWDSNTQLLATCDSLVEGIHFLRRYITPEQLGQRALAVNLSDIAAMGGRPLYALISLMVPPDLPPGWLERLYTGLRALAEMEGVSIVGGNVAASAHGFAIDITLLGAVASGRAVLRSGARPGDLLYVTGHLGRAAAGLLTLLQPPSAWTGVRARALADVRSALLTPTARVAEGQALAAHPGTTAMLDISDGLAADLNHLCQCSQVGATITVAALPIDRATRTVAHAFNRDARDLALFGGEDYELLFTVTPSAESTVRAALAAVGGAATAIGTITPAETGLRLLERDNTSVPLEPHGWDHLRASDPVDHFTFPPDGSSCT